MSQTKFIPHGDRLDNYLAQNPMSRKALTPRQERQLALMDRRQDNKVKAAVAAALPTPSRGVTLPELGAVDDHSRMMLDFGYALQTQGKHIYAGTVPYQTKVRRRNTNKRARAARRAGRR